MSEKKLAIIAAALIVVGLLADDLPIAWIAGVVLLGAVFVRKLVLDAVAASKQ